MTPAAQKPTQPRSSHAPELRAAARHFDRRRFLTVTGAAAALAFATNLPAAGAVAAAQLDTRQITAYPCPRPRGGIVTPPTSYELRP